MSFDVNKNLAFNEIQNKVLFLSNLIKVHSIKIIDSISKEFLLQCSLEILRKPPGERTPNEQNLLVKCTQDIQFFKEYIERGESSVHVNCCKCMQNQFLNAGETVFYKDSIGTKFYLILSGSVGVYVMLPSSGVDNTVPDNLVLTEVKILRAGTTFGELALISKKPRAATIICKEDCNLGVLEKKDFNSILKYNEERKLIEEMNFFADLNIFHHWNFNLVKHLYLNTHSVHLIKDDYVFKENDESEAVYIIKFGEFMILKQIIIEENCEEMNIDVDRYSIEKWRKHFGGDLKKNKQAEIALLTNGEIFGEEDLMKNRKRSYSIKCISPKGIVRIISKKNFIQRVCVDKTTQSLIEEMNEKKDKWFQVKIEETRKIFQTNKEILTQNMSKDFILNKFLKNHPKSKINEKYIQLENIDKMRTTKFFRFKRSLNSQSLEAERYLEEKAEFEKIKSDFEKKMCSNSSQKKMLKLNTNKQIRINFFMQNLPKIQQKKIPSFKSPFLESLTKNASVIQSENTDATLLKVNSYDISIGNINNNIIYCNSHNNNSNSRHINPKESRNLGLIKKGFRKIFNNEEKKIEPKENKSFFFDTKKRKDIFKKNSLSSFDGNQKIEIVQFPRITETDFKKVIEKNRKNLKVIINRNITPEPLLYDTIQSKFDFENKINDKKISKEI